MREQSRAEQSRAGRITFIGIYVGNIVMIKSHDYLVNGVAAEETKNAI